jgi:hypothetical protein
MSEFNAKSIVLFKRSTIKKLKNEFQLLKTDIIENKDLYENCLKIELEKNAKLRNLIKDISSNLSIFILDSENQLIYIEKLLKENKLLSLENDLLKKSIKFYCIIFGTILFFCLVIFLIFFIF